MSTETNKWVCEAGPLQTKKVNKALSDLRWEASSYTQKSGVIGVSESESSFTQLYGGTRSDLGDYLKRLGDKFDWKITRENYTDVIAEAGVLLAEMRKTRPVKDTRITPEQDKAQREEREALIAKREADAAAKLAGFIAEYGAEGTTAVAEGSMPVCAVLTYDNSDMMSDYSDSHATIGCALLIGVASKQARTEALARHFLGRYPELASLTWEWHTENYSMGHGNYLRSSPVQLPEVVSKSVHKAPTTGRWEIQFRCWDKEVRRFKGFPGQGPAAAFTTASSDAPNGGSVRYNSQHDGVEVTFPGKPSAEVIGQLKAAGFRWSFRSRVWYKRYGAYAWAQAHTICGIEQAPCPKTQTAEVRDPGEDAADRWNEQQACA